MRIVRLHDGEDVVDFHPYVTVVRGLSDQQRAQLLATLAALPAGRKDGLDGLVEAHGIVLDYSDETLELLTLANTELDVIVRPSDLPGVATSAAARQLRASQRTIETIESRAERLLADLHRAREDVAVAEAEVQRLAAERQESQISDEDKAAHADDLARRRAEAEAILEAAYAGLESANEAVERARARLSDVDQQTAPVLGDHRAIVAECQALAAAIEQAQVGLDPDAEANLEAARAHAEEALAQIEAERAGDDPEDGASPDAVRESPAEALERLEQRRRELDAHLAALEPTDPGAVYAALARANRGADEVTMVPDEAAYELADELRQVADALLRLEQVEPTDPDELAAARARLDAARSVLVEVEQAARTPDLERDDTHALELAHHEVLEAQDRIEGRFAGGRAQKRLDDARARESELLEKLGFTTYADYMMGTSILHVDPEQEERLDEARAELAAAEDAWAVLQEAATAENEREEMLERQRLLRDRAKQIVGPGAELEDLEHALRAYRVPATHDVSAAEDLRFALQHVGLAVAHEDLELDELISFATDWLDEEEQAAIRRDALIAERDEVADHIGRLQFETLESERMDHEPDPEERRAARAQEAERAVAAAEERVRRHEDALVEVERLEAELAAAQGRDASTSDEAGPAEALMEAAEAAVELAVTAADHAREEIDQANAVLAALDAEEIDFANQAGASDSTVDVEQAVAEERLESARLTLQRLENEYAEVEREISEHQEGVAALQEAVERESTVTTADAEEVEWYLLARLAAQRQVSFAGSVPLVLDDALVDLQAEAIPQVLDRLERMAAAVQLIVISDDAAVARWAGTVGEHRVAVVQPIPVGAATPIV